MKLRLRTPIIIVNFKTYLEATGRKAIALAKQVEKVLYASNIPKDMMDDLEHYAGLSEVVLQKFKGTNQELGVICKRALSILVVALLKK